MAEKSIPDNIMDGTPDIDELITHAKTAEWNGLGIKLGLNAVSLGGCNGYIKLYQLWLDEKGHGATRRVLINALRSINQNKVADDYVVKYLKTLVS